jgi:transposase
MLPPLSDSAWRSVCHLFPEDRQYRFGNKSSDPRAVLNAILWVRARGAPWRALPADFPPFNTCHIKSLQWRRLGVLDQALQILEAQSISATTLAPAPGYTNV